VVVVVLIAGERVRMAFRHKLLSEDPEIGVQEARRFVAEELPPRTVANAPRTA
jgi:hypothetical protein